MKKVNLVKLVVCRDNDQARAFLSSLNTDWKVYGRDLFAKRGDEEIVCRVYKEHLSPLSNFGCRQFNSIEYLTFDFGENYDLVTRYLTSRLRSIYEPY